jgi:hypothetical protein
VGSLDDELLLTPASIVVTPSSVVVSDLGTSGIVSFDRYRLNQQWRIGKDGDGPGEYRRPFLLPDTDSSVVVLDVAHRRLQVVSSAGSLREARALASFGGVSGVCRHDDRLSWWLKMIPSGRIELNGVGLLRDGDDSLALLRPLDLGAPTHRSGIGATAALVRSEDGRCVVAPTHFSWIGVLGEDGVLEKLPLVESVPAPAVEIVELGARSRRITPSAGTVAITRGLAVSEERAFVIAMGRSFASGRLIDIYRRRPWAYEGSLVFPGHVLSVSAADSTLAVISEDQSGYHRVTVATMRSPQ